jgi:hypothetical protein
VPSLLWEARELDKIPDDEKYGQALKTKWCPVHGDEFCNAVLSGDIQREDVPESERSRRNLLAAGDIVLSKAQQDRKRERDVLREEVLSKSRPPSGLAR